MQRPSSSRRCADSAATPCQIPCAHEAHPPGCSHCSPLFRQSPLCLFRVAQSRLCLRRSTAGLATLQSRGGLLPIRPALLRSTGIALSCAPALEVCGTQTLHAHALPYAATASCWAHARHKALSLPLQALTILTAPLQQHYQHLPCSRLVHEGGPGVRGHLAGRQSHGRPQSRPRGRLQSLAADPGTPAALRP